MQAEVNRSNIEKLSHKDKVRFALYCAKQVVHLADAPETKECMKIVELWLDSKATEEECRAAAAYATNAAHAAYATANAADAAAYATANAAYAAAANANAANATYATYAADAAANAAAYAAANANAAGADIIKQKQMEYLYELIHKDEIIEQTLLKTIRFNTDI